MRGTYRGLRVGTYRVLCEVEADVVTVVRVDKAPERLAPPVACQQLTPARTLGWYRWYRGLYG